MFLEEGEITAAVSTSDDGLASVAVPPTLASQLNQLPLTSDILSSLISGAATASDDAKTSTGQDAPTTTYVCPVALFVLLCNTVHLFSL